ncbi:MAG TPA: dihydropyrimidinase [Verrucomicrobia bacterium]|nr:MAG: dihydropyrimidinase [Lentisphaerae bacterium GWF2_57_35]HBA85751.1 dihydropyrimidinase [Verrucomicrobiota bacterium]
MSLLIQNGEVVTAEGRAFADILCEGETIVSIERHLPKPAGAEVVDAAGCYVFPGFIDPHVHAYLPLKDFCSKADYASTSRAALIGGTTFFFDFCGASRDETPLEALARWNDMSRGNSACDFSYHMTVARFDPRMAEQLAAVVQRGIPSFKVYLAYQGVLDLGDAELLQVLTLAKKLGALTLAHCENAGTIAARQQELLAEGKTGPEWHEPSRPSSVEADGVRHFLEFAGRAGASAYVVHLSCAEALQQAEAARQRGVRVHIETMPHYLLLDRTYAERPHFEGAKYVLSPPLRDKSNQPVLWAALARGAIETVGTDHCPFDFEGQKTLGRDCFTKIPNGIGGIEDRINLLHTYGVLEGRLDLSTLVAVASSNPAKLFGLYPRKGALQVGSDADLVVYDPAHPGVISARTQSTQVDYNPYEGFAVRGRPRVVTVRGEIAVRDGVFVGDAGRGRFTSREASL